MFNIGPGELMVILLLALILLGPEKLPEVARSVGKGMKELRRASEDLRQTVEQELYKVDVEAEVKKTPGAAQPPAVGASAIERRSGMLPPPGAEPLAAPPLAIEVPPAGSPPSTPTEGAPAAQPAAATALPVGPAAPATTAPSEKA